MHEITKTMPLTRAVRVCGYIDRFFISSTIGVHNIYTIDTYTYTCINIYIQIYVHIHTDININKDLTSHNTYMYIYIWKL